MDLTWSAVWCSRAQPRKRSRWGSKAEAPAAAAPAPVEDKAAQLAAKQAKIQEQMAAMAALLGPAAGGVGAAAAGGTAALGAAAAVQRLPSFSSGAGLNPMGAPGGAKALTMDADGNLLDERGQIVQSGTQRAAVTSLKVNMNAETKKQFKVDSSSTLNAQVRANPYFDPRMKAAVHVTRKSRSLNFHGIDRKAGTFAKAAEKGRKREREGEGKGRGGQGTGRGGEGNEGVGMELGSCGRGAGGPTAWRHGTAGSARC